MWLEALRLCFGILLMALHRQIADYILRYEHALHGVLAARGMNLPQPFDERTAYNVYFGLGALVCLISMTRIWMGLHG
jgi:hypothetical protein